MSANIFKLKAPGPKAIDLARRKLLVTASRLSLDQVARLNEIADLMNDELRREDQPPNP